MCATCRSYSTECPQRHVSALCAGCPLLHGGLQPPAALQSQLQPQPAAQQQQQQQQQALPATQAEKVQQAPEHEAAEQTVVKELEKVSM